MVNVDRREWLRRISSLGMIGLAGCSKSDSPPANKSTTHNGTETTNMESQTTQEWEESSISTDITLQELKDSQQIIISGVVVEPAGINEINIEIGDSHTKSTLNGETRHELDSDLTIAGGQRYSGTITVTASDGSENVKELDLGVVPTPLNPVEADRIVGAHYYPWYNGKAEGPDWRGESVSNPILGQYSSENQAVIDQHLRWCLNAGIQWLSVSWWGPNHETDLTLRDELLGADLFQDIQFSILYETKGRLEEFDYDLDETAARNRLQNDLQYLEDEYFDEDNYFHLNDQPVIFLYIADVLRGDIEEAFNEITKKLRVDPYFLADIPFGTPPANYEITSAGDAVTTYNPYSARPDIESVFHDLYQQGNTVLHLGSDAADVDYVPVVIPGYNDTELPDTQREDNPILSASPDRYEQVCSEVAPHLGEAPAVLLTSFNEWYENTQIEPNESHGDAYLTLTREKLATGSVPEFSKSGTQVRFSFNETRQPSNLNPESEDSRELALVVSELRFTNGGTVIADYNIGTAGDEPIFLEGVYRPESNGDRSWRWFGGKTEQTTIYVEEDISKADTGILVGQPIVSNEIEANTHVDGNQTGHVKFGARDGYDEYLFGLE